MSNFDVQKEDPITDTRRHFLSSRSNNREARPTSPAKQPQEDDLELRLYNRRCAALGDSIGQRHRLAPLDSRLTRNCIPSRFTHHGLGSAGDEDGVLSPVPTEAPTSRSPFDNKNADICPAILAPTFPVFGPCHSRRLPAWAPIYTVPSRGYLGVDFEGCSQEEDITHEEEAQADGRQSFEGRHELVQVPCLRRNQEDALSMSELHSK